jgi:uncharacterized protein
MFFHVILTNECDLQCRYCHGKMLEDMGCDFQDFEIDYTVPNRISYEIELLRKFCQKDPQSVLIFYGGEPLLNPAKMKQIMDTVEARHFILQTNGLHLNTFEPEHLNKLLSIFVSIDGDEELTDYYRGRRVYRKVIENIKLAKKNRFEGEIIARMTVTEETDIYHHIIWLLHNPDYTFSSIHWQLDAGFWQNDFANRPFAKWIEEDYNPGIRKLAKFWVDHMENEGEVLRLYPFLGVMQSLLKAERSLLRCGSGWINYTIQTDGYIVPCPIMSGMKDYYLGHIENSHPLLLQKVYVGHPCSQCEILHECGGRCLYANITKRWDEDAYAVTCGTVKNLTKALQAVLPRIRSLIHTGRINLSDFQHMKYNSCEIIP